MLDIKKYINDLSFNNYLKHVEWTPNLTASGYDDKYLQYVELDKLQSDIIAWVNQKLPHIDKAYQQAIKTAEVDLNLHGYSVDTLLNGKPLPQTKSKIDNFADSQSFHDWLQAQANIKFHGWQLTMGLGIGLPLALVALTTACWVRRKTNPKYNPYAWARKRTRQRKAKIK
ncbi:hypothetical protein [Spiroplasma endosymbiont of Nebria brevicollis]|uniref:hypothetical protein n=1 Tax=Spiroplasma endosymbiont of Nebria brevicollis TaxID=3066284 RepID=UPI00313BC5BA